jgi:hypothetical protein
MDLTMNIEELQNYNNFIASQLEQHKVYIGRKVRFYFQDRLVEGIIQACHFNFDSGYTYSVTSESIPSGSTSINTAFVQFIVEGREISKKNEKLELNIGKVVTFIIEAGPRYHTKYFRLFGTIKSIEHLETYGSFYRIEVLHDTGEKHNKLILCNRVNFCPDLINPVVSSKYLDFIKKMGNFEPNNKKLIEMYDRLEATQNNNTISSKHNITNEDAITKGLINKYKLEHTDGSPVNLKAQYFVLRIDNEGRDKEFAAASRAGLIRFAEMINATNKQLAKDLFDLVAHYHNENLEGREPVHDEIPC